MNTLLLLLTLTTLSLTAASVPSLNIAPLSTCTSSTGTNCANALTPSSPGWTSTQGVGASITVILPATTWVCGVGFQNNPTGVTSRLDIAFDSGTFGWNLSATDPSLTELQSNTDLPATSTATVTFTATAVSTTANTGALEVHVYECITQPAYDTFEHAHATNPSGCDQSTHYDPKASFDCLRALDNSSATTWATQGQNVGAWMQVHFGAPALLCGWGSVQRAFWAEKNRGVSLTVAPSSDIAAAACADTAASAATGDVLVVDCPANCNSPATGCGPFAETSSVCTAARFAGINGGPVQFSVTGTTSSFSGCTQNGVTTTASGSAARSFTVSSPTTLASEHYPNNALQIYPFDSPVTATAVRYTVDSVWYATPPPNAGLRQFHLYRCEDLTMATPAAATATRLEPGDTFSVTMAGISGETGDATFAYEWIKYQPDNSAMPGEVSTTLTLTNVQTSDNAAYYARASRTDFPANVMSPLQDLWVGYVFGANVATTAAGATCTASSNAGTCSNAFEDGSGTWASSQGAGAYLEVTLPQSTTICGVAWHNGDSGSYGHATELSVSFTNSADDVASWALSSSTPSTNEIQVLKLPQVATTSIRFTANLVSSSPVAARAVHVYACAAEPATELANAQTCSASTYHQNLDYFACDRALDGPVSTEWASNLENIGAWMEVTLPSASALCRFGVHQRADYREKNADITLSFDGGASTQALRNYPHDDLQVFDLNAAVTATTVRYTVDSYWRELAPPNAGLREFRLYECDSISVTDAGGADGKNVSQSTSYSLVGDVASDALDTISYIWRKDGTPLSDGARVSGSTTPTLTLTDLQVADSGTYTCKVSGSIRGSSDEVISADNTLTVSDVTAPVVSPVSIISNNTDNTATAVNGDLITLTFSSDEDAVGTPTVTIAGRAATVMGGPRDFTATIVSQAGDPTGTVQFSITGVADAATNTAAEVTSTTDASQVVRGCGDLTYGDTCSCSIAPSNDLTEYPMDLILYTETNTPPAWTRLQDSKLYIVYDESIHYSTVAHVFNNTDDLCSQHWTWSSTVDEPSCTRTWVGEMVWANWGDCDIERSTSGDDIEFLVNFGAKVTEVIPGLRDGTETRTVKHIMPFTLGFPTRVIANSSDIVAFSPVVEIGAIVEQTLKGTPGTDISMDVSFLTSVQWPFVLESATWGTITADDNGSPDAFTLETTAGSCDDNNATEPNCQNTWSSTVYPANQTTTCELDGQYTVNWVVDCHDSVKASNDCPIDTNTDDATLTFTIDTSSFCVQVADTVTLSANIYTYEDAAHTILKDDFLDGQTVYAEVPTSSDKVSIDSTRVVDATIVRDTEADISLIADGDIVLPNDYAVARADGGSSAAGVSSRPSFQFTVNTASTHMDLADDSSETMTLAATVSVRYQNAGQAAFSKVRFETALQTKEKDVAASTSVGFGGTQSTTTGTSSAASSEATIMGVNAMVVYGAGAIMALVLITAYVVLRRSDPAPAVNKSESQVQLTSTAGETNEARV